MGLLRGEEMNFTKEIYPLSSFSGSVFWKENRVKKFIFFLASGRIQVILISNNLQNGKKARSFPGRATPRQDDGPETQRFGWKKGWRDAEGYATERLRKESPTNCLVALSVLKRLLFSSENVLTIFPHNRAGKSVLYWDCTFIDFMRIIRWVMISFPFRKGNHSDWGKITSNGLGCRIRA